MRSVFYSSFLSIYFLFPVLYSSAQFQYLSPVPGSKFNNPETGIILRNGNLMDESSIDADELFSVQGSLSGNHEISYKLADGGRVILLQPLVPFSEGETVSVTVANGIQTNNGKEISGTTFSFQIHESRTEEQKQKIEEARKLIFAEELGNIKPDEETIRDITHPGIPDFSILTNTNPAPGEVFFDNFKLFGTQNSHYCIIESNGDSVYGIFDTVSFNNFGLNHNGYLTVYNQHDADYDVVDSNYVKVAKVQMGNGYLCDVHELQMYPDRTFAVAYDIQVFDMTIYDPNYQEDALVAGCIIQELDADQNVIFQWRTWDHFEVTDASHQSFFNGFIDYAHINSVELDKDGNLIASFRHMDEITKINRTTGDVMWRMGGKKNQFNFIGDPDKFNYQHDARRIANGNITLFDNGNYHTPPRSWAKEYSVDEVNKKATLAWSYSRTVASGNVFGNAMGNVQRLDNGNTFICWGLIFGPDYPNITEVNSQGKVVWEFKLSSNDAIYRAFRKPWDPCSRPTSSKTKVKNITSNSANITWNAATNAVKYNVQYKVSGSSNWIQTYTVKPNKKLTGLSPSTVYQYQVRSLCDLGSGTSSGFTKLKQFKTNPLKNVLAEDAGELSMQIFPNPSNGVANIAINWNGEKEARLSVYNLEGKLVYASDLSPGEDSKTVPLYLNDVSPGFYFVEILMDGERVVNKLVIE